MSNLQYTGPEFSISNLLQQERAGMLSPQQVDLLSNRHFDGLRQEAGARERSSALGILSTTELVVITPNVVEFFESKVRDMITQPMV